MKKIIAREILILFSTFCITLLFVIGTFGYNLFKDSQIKNLTNQKRSIDRKSDELDYIFDYKQRNHLWFFEAMRREMNFDLSNKELNNEKNFWSYAIQAKVFGKIDSVVNRWDGKWKKSGLTDHFKHIGFSTPQKLNEFIIEKSISSADSANHKSAYLLKKDSSHLADKIIALNESKLEKYEQRNLGYQFFVTFLFLLFGLRYIYYLLKWCIRTLTNS